MTLAALALLAGASWTLGTAALWRTPWPELRPYERAALRLAAGLGLTALLLSVAALTGWFGYSSIVLAFLTFVPVLIGVRHLVRLATRGIRRRRVEVPHSRPWPPLAIAIAVT